MLNYTYTPFINTLESLDQTDLLRLKEIPEGWYIDYKSKPLKTIDLAKHLAAFANQYGGWLIFGISETEDGTRCAGSFCGISNTEIPNLSLQLREASSAHINPEVLYEEKIFKGPSDVLGLPDGKSILIVGIPQSTHTPHIHSSGRIYRRLADQSKPKEETDRYLLDELWNRGESHRQKVSNFLCATPPLPKSAADTSWAYIYLRPDENQPRPNKTITFEEFSEITTNQNRNIQGPYALMDSIYSAPNGFIARQTKGNDPSLPAFSLRWWHDGTVRFEIPLNKYSLQSLLEDSTTKHAQEFSAILLKIGFTHASLVDYSKLLMSVSSLMNMYLELSKKTGDTRDLYSSFILKNISYTSPYLDTAHFLSKIEKYSLPLTIENEIRIPNEPSQSTMFQHKYEKLLELTSQPNSEIYKSIIFAAPLFANIFLCVGVIHGGADFEIDTEMYGLGITYSNK